MEVDKLRTQARNKARKCLPLTHIRTYTIPWSPGGVQPSQMPEHKKYLEAFSGDFESGIKMLVESAKHDRDNLVPASEYYSELDETLQHLHFCVEKCANFKGQTDMMESVGDYLISPQNRKPLVIYAESGVGKTSVMAMIMKTLPKWFGIKNCIRVIRFLGTSPRSTDIYQVVRSVIGQLADIHDQILEPDGSQNMKSIVKYLPRFLRNIGRKTKQHIFLLLDSIDQLSPSNGAHEMKWLPDDYPPNVHIIISMLPKTHNCLVNAQNVIKDNKCFLELKPIPESTGQEIIDAYMESKHRTITKDQNRQILNCLEKAPSPLFLKLLMDRSLTWHSYTPVDDIHLLSSIREAINKQFIDLETKFGSKFIQAALGYITVGLNGLTEIELEDVLSCNDEVLDEVYQYHSPPVEGIIRIPGLLWARVRHDISEYIADRLSDGKKTIYWYHRQFIEAARDMYVDGDREKALHKDLATLYLAEEGIKKSITLSKRNLTITDADRQVTPQSLDERNKRKLNALSYHNLHARDIDFAKENVYCNIRFMSIRSKAFGVKTLLQDLEDAMNSYKDDEELKLIYNCFCDLNITVNSDVLPGEILARVPERDDMSSITQLRANARQCIENSGKPALMPLYACLYDGSTESNEYERNRLIDVSGCSSLLFTGIDQVLTAERNGIIRLWDIQTLRKVKQINLFDHEKTEDIEYSKLMLINDGKHIVLFSRKNKFVKLVDLNFGTVFDSPVTGEVLSICDGLTGVDIFVVAGSKSTTDVYNIAYDSSDFNKTTVKKYIIKSNLATSTDIDMCKSSSGKLLLFKILCTSKEREIILKSEKLNNLFASLGMYKFCALDLKSSEFQICHRNLTNIICLGNCWNVCSNEDWMLIGRERFIYTWDLTNFKCNQRLFKGTKTHMFYRPEWIEEGETRRGGGKTLCNGKTLCIARGKSPNSHFASGSEEGFLLVFDGTTGQGVGGYIGTKPNHGNSPVCIYFTLIIINLC